MSVAVLFARADSVYKSMPDCDVYDIARDARTWPGGSAVIAHPPCRSWGRLRKFAKPRPGERELAYWAIEQVQKFGGVLEHPAQSSLWDAAGLPEPGVEHFDQYCGWSLVVDQFWWGHRARKRTYLYIVGCDRSDIPDMPIVLGEPSHVVSSSAGLRMGMRGWRPAMHTAERERTPAAFARWLVDLASRCRV